MYKAAILGYGVVGSGVAKLIDGNQTRIKKATSCGLNLKKIVDLRDFPGDRFEGIMTKSFDEVLSDPEITAVAETIGGTGIAYKFTKALLEAGKSVITSNKELIAEKGEELLAVAARKDAHYLFEASVGGGIPIIKPMVTSLEANNYTRIKAILNGTTNYILTSMKEKGLSFETALKNAQALGYAEKNPDADIKGIDAQRKIAILADIAYGVTVPPSGIHTTGIEAITPEIMTAAEQQGYAIKLICYAENTGNELCIFVSPCALPLTDPLSTVNDVFNGITFSCDFADEMTFTGRGAGSLPTASAVVSDMIEACVSKPAATPLWQAGNITVSGPEKMSFEYLHNTEIPILK